MRHETLFKHAAISIGIDNETLERVMQAYKRLLQAEQKTKVLQDDTQAMVTKLRAYYDFTSPPGGRVTAGEACKLIGIDRPTRAQCMMMGEALRITTQRRPFKTNGRLVYVVPSDRATSVTL